HHGDWHHHHWHHGHWHGDAGGWWNHMWSDHTALMAFGTTMWGLNRAAYAFGYWGYSNPYYTESYPVSNEVVINYSEPMLEQPVESADPAAAAAPQPGMSDFDQARQAFYDVDYAAALAATDKALAAMPSDAVMQEFRA